MTVEPKVSSPPDIPEVYILLGIVSLVIYFLPSLIAYKKRISLKVFLLNLFLGWTIIGWAIALLWAISTEQTPMATIADTILTADKAAHLQRLKSMHINGVLSDEEYETEKKKLLL